VSKPKTEIIRVDPETLLAIEPYMDQKTETPLTRQLREAQESRQPLSVELRKVRRLRNRARCLTRAHGATNKKRKKHGRHV
jgi:hypothetical protein